MTFDTLTLAGVLLTLLYIVLLVAFNRRKDTAKPAAMFVFKDTEDEAYPYGVPRNTSVQSASGPCNSCV